MTPSRFATLDRVRPWDSTGSSSQVFAQYFRSSANLVAILLSEYRRAVAASHRYEELRRKERVALVRIGVASADIAPCILQEFYSSTGRGFSR
jgi:hypothetical protein